MTFLTLIWISVASLALIPYSLKPSWVYTGKTKPAVQPAVILGPSSPDTVVVDSTAVDSLM